MRLRNISLCEEHNAVFTGFSNLNNNVGRFFLRTLFFLLFLCTSNFYGWNYIPKLFLLHQSLVFILCLIFFWPHRFPRWTRSTHLCTHNAVFIRNFSLPCPVFVYLHFELCLFHFPLLFSYTLPICFKRGWLPWWPPWSFTNPVWQSLFTLISALAVVFSII